MSDIYYIIQKLINKFSFALIALLNDENETLEI